MAPTSQTVDGNVFEASMARLRASRHRPEVAVREVPAPRRLAPAAIAFAADLQRVEPLEGRGRLVMLHDPDGQQGWEGPLRVVSQVEVELEPVMAADPMLGAVTWSWLLEALGSRGATHHAIAGSVTRTASSRFGAMADDGEEAQLELRASWSPALGDDLVSHQQAWTDLLCLMAGLPPPGTVPLRR